ncbi:dUTP diphosphatase [Candidatus Uhrbacteria bacterium]|nr:dUTP diphosphatase [Candidatus Uhrbacteria bacterium]
MAIVPITRIDPSIPLPAYQTAGAAGFDLTIRADATIAPGATMLVPANIIIAIPSGHVLLLAARSSLWKRGLVLANGVGIVDEDYRGPNDEIGLLLRNVSDAPVTVQRGDRLAQALLMPVARAEWTEREQADIIDQNRGGFGSTGS